MTATTEAIAPLAGIWNAARERLEARRNVHQSPSEAERRKAWMEVRELPQGTLYAPRFRPPSSAAEYFDDKIIERNRQYWGLPETAVLLEVAAAARENASAAVRAVRAARKLDARVQWVVCQNVREWGRDGDAARTGADRITAAVLGEWHRLGLQEEAPAGDE